MEIALASHHGGETGGLRLWVSGLLPSVYTTETRLSCLSFLSEGLPLPSTKESRFKLE